jgi:hypothetical protein
MFPLRASPPRPLAYETVPQSILYTPNLEVLGMEDSNGPEKNFAECDGRYVIEKGLKDAMSAMALDNSRSR